MFKLLKYISMITFIFSLFAPLQTVAGNAPQLISYQGVLTDTAGKPVPDGNYEVTFSIYDAPTGGKVLWTEAWTNTTTPISTIKGNFSVMLNSIAKNWKNIFYKHSNIYLGIKIGADTEMLPRQQVSSVAYAFNAGNGVPSKAIIMWSGSIDTIPDGWVLCNGENGTPDLRDRFIAGAGNAYLVGDKGGSASLSIADHTHTIAAESPGTSAAPDHTHSGLTGGITSYSFQDVGPNYDDVSASQADHKHAFTTDPAGTHSHTVNSHAHGGVTGASGGGASLDNRPPYYALAFIMKL